MKRLSCLRALAPTAVALAAAELGVRLLRPRERPLEPALVDLHEYFDDEQIARGARFARPQLLLGLARGGIELSGLWLAARRPPARLAGLGSPAAGGALVGATLSLGGSLLPLPIAAVARRRARAVGLVTQSWRGWAVDLVKSAAIGTGLSAAGGAMTVAVTRRFPRHWWLAGGSGSVFVGTAFAALAPVLLDPIFNDFTPLPEGETRSDVLALAGRAGVKVGEVYSIDASRRTSAANAYVSGLGPTKRVVLFDTLLDRYSRDEVRVVVAHELAHVRHRDVARGVLYAAVAAPAAARAVQRASSILTNEPGTPAALPAIALAAGLVGAPIGMVGSRLSRAIERRADQYALDLTAAPEAFISFDRTIAIQNVADLDPPRWVRWLLSSHPPTAERIGAAVAWGRHRNGHPAPVS